MALCDGLASTMLLVEGAGATSVTADETADEPTSPGEVTGVLAGSVVPPPHATPSTTAMVGDRPRFIPGEYTHASTGTRARRTSGCDA